MYMYIFPAFLQLLHVSLNPEGNTTDWAWNTMKTWWELAWNGAMFVSYTRSRGEKNRTF